MGSDKNLHAAVRFPDRNELVALVQCQSPDAVAAEVLQRLAGKALDGAVAGDHDQETFAGGDVVCVDHGADTLAGLDGKDVH